MGDWPALIEKIRCPTILIHGDQDAGCDGIVTAVLAKKINGLNGNIIPVRVPGAGHNLRREQFDAFVTEVRGFLISR